jgi:hypothetical protein
MVTAAPAPALAPALGAATFPVGAEAAGVLLVHAERAEEHAASTEIGKRDRIGHG